MTLAIAPVIAREVRKNRRKAEYRPSRPARPDNGSPGEGDRTVKENLLYAVGAVGRRLQILIKNLRALDFFSRVLFPGIFRRTLR